MFVAFLRYRFKIGGIGLPDENIVVLDTDDMTVEAVNVWDLRGMNIRNLDELFSIERLSLTLVLRYCKVKCRHLSLNNYNDIHFKKWDFCSDIMDDKLLTCNEIPIRNSRCLTHNIAYMFEFHNYCVLRCIDTNAMEWYSLVFDEYGNLICEWTQSMSVCKGDSTVALKIDTLSEV